MEVQMHKSWKLKLEYEFQQPYFTKLSHFIETEYVKQLCYPQEAAIFAAFIQCSFEDIKIVIIGQDPYHGPKQANGLCFSVMDGVSHPPSLVNIFKEIETDLGQAYPSSGNLERWAKQGIFAAKCNTNGTSASGWKPSENGVGEIHRYRN